MHVNLIIRILLLLSALLLAGCNQKRGNETPANDPLESEGNKSLEKQAWKIHDEVMPKMGALHKKKNQLKDQLRNPDLAPEKRQEIEETITDLDKAYDAMMVWMRKFKPEEHNETEETVREYLENEIESIKKVKMDILNALEKADRVAGS